VQRGRKLPAVATAGGRVATWTVLFTDMVVSTERRVRVGEDVFDRVRADLDRRVDRAVEAHNGSAVKSTGDGILAGFAATASALHCAAAIQAAVRDRNRETGDDVALRIGISVGDAVVEDGDLQGTAVVEAARICALAEPGTILCSASARAVSANRSGCAFGEAHSVELKGLPGPVIVYEVTPDASVDRPDSRALTFRVLGPVEVERDGRVVGVGGPKERLVLAVLLASAATTVSVDALADAIWGERPPRTAERTVHAYIARLRRALEPRRRSRETPAVIETVGRGYRLRIDSDQVDAGSFEQLARSGAEQLHGDPTAAAAALRAALGEWRGRAYAGLDDVGPCAAEATRLNALRLGAVEDRVDADLAVGSAAALVPELEAAVEDQPFRERLWGQLMVALYRSGRQRDALEAFQRARRTLVDELGIEPGPELRRLEAAILDQDPALDERRPLPRSTGPAGLPLPLAAVGSAFVGRDREVTWLRSAWADADDGRGGFVSILGPEGAGKTRLVAEVAREAQGNGAVVLYGRCDHAHRGARALVHQAFGSADGSIGEIDHAADVTDLATAVVRHLSAWADGRPVMLVLDDLHLADAEALEFVADLAGWCQATRLLVVGIFRTDGPVPTAPDGDDPTGDESRLVLGPLGYDDVAGICRLYEPEGWSAEDVRRVADLSDGLPLLVHEQASALAEARAARRVEQAAGRLAASRGRLLTSRGEVADGVETIQQLLEQRRAQLAGREAQLQAEGVSALAGCPYKGLARFEAADADNFFGRERLVAELLARVSETSVVAVVGPSGSGKSSLLRAGLLPALAAGVLAGGDPWRTVALCPGARPTEELAARRRDLPSSGAPRAVLIDQFEETFTLGASPDEQVQFIDRLLALSREPATRVVLAVRADHLGRCAAHPELAAQLAGNDVLVGPMRDSELRRSVELPAQRAGLEIEPGLVEVIVGDVAGRAGALPLLSTALAETWERREGRRLTLAGYRAAGRVNGALARLAEDGYAAIPAPARPAARRILLRLCDVGEDAALDVRRRLPLTDVVDENDHDGRVALDALADRRLLTVHGDTVEVAHESLLREWPRLRAWLEEDIEGRRLHRRLGDAARAWDADSRDPSELYRGTQLHAAGDWAHGHADALNRLERDFLDASRGAAEAQRRTAHRRRRRLIAVLAGAAAVATILGSIAVVQANRATSERDRALTAEQDAQIGALVNQSLALRSTDRAVAALLAVEAHRRAAPGDPRAHSALLGTFTAAPGFMGYLHLSQDEVPLRGAAVPGTDQAVVAVKGRDLRLLDLDSGELEDRFPPLSDIEATPPDAARTVVAVSADGRYVAHLVPTGADRLCVDLDVRRTTDNAGCAALLVHEIASGKRVVGPVTPPVALPGRQDKLIGPGDLAVNADGSLVAVAGGYDGKVVLYHTHSGEQVGIVPGVPRPGGAANAQGTVRSGGLPGAAAAVAFGPDGRLYVGSMAGPVRVVDPATLAVVTTYDAPRQSTHNNLTVTPDGLLVGSGDANAVAIDTATGAIRWTADITVAGEASPCPFFAVSAPMRRFYCGNVSGVLVERELATGERTGVRLDPQLGDVGDLAVGADGRELVAFGGSSAVVSRWRLDGSGPIIDASLPGWGTNGYDPAGELLVVFEGERTSYSDTTETPPDFAAWDPATGEIVDQLDPIVTAIWVAPGKLAALFTDGTLGDLYDVRAHARLDRPTPGADVAVYNAELSAGGTRIYIEGHADDGTDGRCEIWSVEAATGRPVGPVIDIGPCPPISGLEATADGSRVAFSYVGPDGRGTEIYDGRTGEKLAGPLLGLNVTAIGPDGTLLGGDVDGRVTQYDLDTLEPIATFPQARGRVDVLEFSADGRLLLVGSPNQNLSIYDVATRTRLGDPIDTGRPLVKGTAGPVLRPDGNAVAVNGRDGLTIWNIEPDHLAAAACDLAGRNLTRSEWHAYLGDLGAYRATCPDNP
jgi:DNA-binding SARP family transcriptional activator/class 3 adenylate cyclase/WD40 repeat protein